jgi:hypothetical protein
MRFQLAKVWFTKLREKPSGFTTSGVNLKASEPPRYNGGGLEPLL